VTAELAGFAALREAFELHADRVLRELYDVDTKLVAKGFPALSPWWRKTFRRWYRSGKRQLVIRAGRRAGKSSSLSRLAVVEALFGKHDIPPGDVGVVAFISTTRDEASQRLATIRAILDALGVKYRPVDGGVGLIDRPVVFKVYAATVSGVSGFTSILVICDEVAKWKDRDTGANPASEVLASVRPTMATQREARIVLSSSPMATVDAHYDAFEEGETAQQCTAHATTWDANPTVTEADTHALEPNAKTRAREYGAIPQDELEESLFSSDDLTKVTRTIEASPALDAELYPLLQRGDIPPEPGHSYVAAMDPATRRNAWTFSIATRRLVDGKVKKSIVVAREWVPAPGAKLSPKATFKAIAEVSKPYGIRLVWTDQWSNDSLAEQAREVGLVLVEEIIGRANKLEMFLDLHDRVLDGDVEFPPGKHFRRDMLCVKKVTTRNGPHIEFVVDGDRHADFAAVTGLVLSKHVDAPVVPNPAWGTPEQVEADAEKRTRARYIANPKKPWWRKGALRA
jgi:hypothetical protein